MLPIPPRRLVFNWRWEAIDWFRGDFGFSLEGLLVAWARAGFDGHGIEATAVLQEVVPRGAVETMALPELMVEANIAELTGDKLQSGQVVRFEIWGTAISGAIPSGARPGSTHSTRSGAGSRPGARPSVEAGVGARTQP